MKTGVVDQMTTAMSTIATPRRDCMGRGEEGAWDEVPGSKDAGICFPFSTRFVRLPRVRRGGVQCMRKPPLEGVMRIVFQRNVFLCFAEALLQVLETADPEASDAEIVQKAVQRVDRQKAGYAWETIPMDVKLVSLPKKAEEHIYAVQDFLEQPYMSAEGEFLGEEDDTTEAIDEYEHRVRGEAYQDEKDLREARRETQGGVTHD